MAVSTSSKTACVNAYTKAGFTLFSCTANFGDKWKGKKPIVAEWQNKPFDPLLAASSLRDVYGVQIPADIAVMDIDPKRFPGFETEGEIDEWAQLKLEGGLSEITTLVVRTGSGGYHVYYRIPAGIKLLSSVPGLASGGKGLSSIECKQKGQFVVGAGSEHFSGETYEIVRGSIRHDAIEDMPASLLLRLSKPATAVKTEKSGSECDDSESTKTLYIQYLMHSAPIAVEGENGDNTTKNVATVGRDYNLSEDATYALLLDYYNPRCSPEWDADDLRIKVRNAYRYARGVKGQANSGEMMASLPPVKNPEPDLAWDMRTVRDIGVTTGYRVEKLTTLRNTINHFLLKDDHTGKAENPLNDLLRYNYFSAEIEFKRPAPWHSELDVTGSWTEDDTVELRRWLSTYWTYNPNKELLCDAALAVARIHGYNPVQEYLCGLKWDRQPRLNKWLMRYLGADDIPINDEWGKNTLIGAVARAMEPGCQMDTMLILEGAEGTGKSSVVRILGGEWYCDIVIDTKNKDTASAMVGGWMIEASEMEFLRRTEISSFRSWFTKLSDKVRPAYARHLKTFPRRSVFIGTFNPDATRMYLEDESGDGKGNRRFCPVLTRSVDIKSLTADRDQIWAEAFYRYQNGEKWHVVDDELIEAGNLQRGERHQNDIWEAVIAQSLSRDRFNGVGGDWDCTTGNIAAVSLGIPLAKFKPSDGKRIGIIMKRLGYEQVRKRLDGNRFYVWQTGTNHLLFAKGL